MGKRDLYIHFMTGLFMVLAIGMSRPSHAQCTDPLPFSSDLLFGWETQADLDAWTATNGAELNLDPEFVREGSASAKVDFSGFPEWSEPLTTVLDPPADWSKYGLVSLDVFVPAGSVAGIPDGDTTRAPYWKRIWLNAPGFRGERDVQTGGWNTLYWVLDPAEAATLSQVRIGGNIERDPATDTGAWTGPLYFDNLRGYAGEPKGLSAGQLLVAGFNDAASIRLLADASPTDAARAGSVSDASFRTEGAGALELDVTGVKGWNPDFLRPADPTAVNLPQPVDLSRACSVLFDVYIPAESPPAWYNVGIRLQSGSGRPFEFSPVALPGWNSFIAPIPDSARDDLKSVDRIWFLIGSGGDDAGTWKGPIYVDAIRASMPVDVPPAMPGDMNGDGKVDVRDATLALRLAVGLLPDATPEQKRGGDVNKDGKNDVRDATLILRKAVGLPVDF